MQDPQPSPQIDREKLRAIVRKMGNELIFSMLDDAIEVLPEAGLREIFGKYIDVNSRCPVEGLAANMRLLDQVRAFEKESRAGEYYESFNVNSRNCTQLSAGTIAWIAKCRRLLDRWVESADKMDPQEARAAVDVIFALFLRIDEGFDDIIFFADEGGSWQVGVDWKKVFPAWFKVLSATSKPEEYAARVWEMLSSHYTYGRKEMLTIASQTATRDQREALNTVQGARNP